jgi:uncharacterized membrane protein YwzB
MDFYLNILELVLFFLSFPFFLKIFNAIDYSRIFRRGFTGNIQIIYVVMVFIISYLFSHYFVELLRLFTNTVL